MGQAKVFEHPIKVVPRDIDRLGHVNNVVYLRYAQDAAVAHWLAVVPAELVEAIVWVARRHEIDYLKPALPGDQLVARTWVDVANGAKSVRYVEIHRPSDSSLIVKVRSVWVALDPATLRPCRVPDALLSAFREPDA